MKWTIRECIHHPQSPKFRLWSRSQPLKIEWPVYPPRSSSSCTPSTSISYRRKFHCSTRDPLPRRESTNSSENLSTPYNWRRAIDYVLDFAIKTNKSYYDQGCKRYYENYEVDSKGRHASATTLIFKVNKFGRGNDTCGILDIHLDKFDPGGNEIHKFLLEHKREFDLPFLADFVIKYIPLNSRASQDNAMLYDRIISSLSLDRLVKVINRSEDYHWGY